MSFSVDSKSKIFQDIDEASDRLVDLCAQNKLKVIILIQIKDEEIEEEKKKVVLHYSDISEYDASYMFFQGVGIMHQLCNPDYKVIENTDSQDSSDG